VGPPRPSPPYSQPLDTRDEIKEVLLQSAIYCGVPAANSTFHHAGEVFKEMDKKKERDGNTKRNSKKRKRQ
jgi:hypothetical protein